ncbi:MAG: hypothetical protein K6G61_01745 [Solobacterium sp.]|nr:hypothetical protein [Solobacterium sp.]
MKELDLNGITALQPLSGCADEWYYALGYPYGDLYEAQELFEAGNTMNGNDLFLVHYPDAEVFRPVSGQPGRYAGEPVYAGRTVYCMYADFREGQIHILAFDCRTKETSVCAEIPLSSVKDCYNLRLHVYPLTLSRQPNDGTFEMIWPERKTIAVESRESFFLRDREKLYFSTWYEDPEYHEVTVIRHADTGEVLERLPGDIRLMPDGQLWYFKGR